MESWAGGGFFSSWNFWNKLLLSFPHSLVQKKVPEGACQDRNWHNADPQACCIFDVAQVRETAGDRMCHPDAIHVRGLTDRGAHLGDSRDSRVGINYGTEKKQEE